MAHVGSGLVDHVSDVETRLAFLYFYTRIVGRLLDPPSANHLLSSGFSRLHHYPLDLHTPAA